MPEPPPQPAEAIEGEYRAVFLAAPDGILITDRTGVILDANPAAGEMFGFSLEELLGEEVELLVPESLREAHRAHREDYVAEPHPRPMGIGLELRGRRKDGSTFPVEISLSPFERGGRGLVIATVRDVSQRLRLRRFGTGTLRAAEEERRRLARELHDDTAQQLASALLRLRVAQATAEDERRSDLLDDLREEILRTAESVRRIARGLRPPALEDVGVVAALRGHVRSLREATEIDLVLEEARVSAALDQALGDAGRLALYRVVQEALSNAVRHSGAGRVTVALAVDDDRIRVEVADDGRGFDRRELDWDEGGGLGLIGMRERAALVGGTFELESEPGVGTRVRVEIPLIPEEAVHG